MKSLMHPKLPQTVCFRLPEVYMTQLTRLSNNGQVSHGEFARQTIIAYLEDEHRERLEEGLKTLQDEIAFLRGDFATALEALLVLAGGGAVKPPEAQAWVEERLRQARTGRG